jgi:hypothetical protein
MITYAKTGYSNWGYTTHSEGTATSVDVMGGALIGCPFNMIGKYDESYA